MRERRNSNYKPFVAKREPLPEVTVRPMCLVLMAVVLGAANAYLGLKVGMTFEATFPAVIIAEGLVLTPFGAPR